MIPNVRISCLLLGAKVFRFRRAGLIALHRSREPVEMTYYCTGLEIMVRMDLRKISFLPNER